MAQKLKCPNHGATISPIDSITILTDSNGRIDQRYRFLCDRDSDNEHFVIRETIPNLFRILTDKGVVNVEYDSSLPPEDIAQHAELQSRNGEIRATEISLFENISMYAISEAIRIELLT